MEETTPAPTEKPILPKNVTATSISEEMKKAYLDYAMSVIVARALPDVRDGLKPVQRRIIYAMYEQGITAASRFQKCAAVVGETMKKYHPHGDMSIYDTLVRMGQDFTLRYPLIEAQGNFGSIDGDPPAAMRYTEARLSKVADNVLNDIDKETVDYVPAYIPSTLEPALLPTTLPNLLVNGTTGIAVGMATNMPPHNLSEVIDALCHLTDHPEASIGDLMGFIKGPDFPTAGSIYNKKDILSAYETGRGGIVMRAKAEIEDTKGGKSASSAGKQQIIVTELPYQVNKAELIIRIAELVKDGKLKGVTDLRDESDRDGLRVMIELKRDAGAQRVLNFLFKHTAMQTAFNCNFVALVNGTPLLLNLKQILEEFLKHRGVIITRRTQFLLRKAKEREHILLGLKIAVDHIDEVIELIKKSPSADEAKKRLMERFKLSEIQATAILDMQLRRLAALERKKIEEELAQVQKTIKELETLLGDRQKILQMIKDELTSLKEKFGDKRKTKVIVGELGTFSEEELVKEEEVFVALTEEGYIKRLPLSTYKSQGRGGKGVSGGEIREGDEMSKLKVANTLDTMLFFTNRGQMYALRVYEIPETSRTAKGTAIVNLLSLKSGEQVMDILSLAKNSWEQGYVIFATKKGQIKKTALKEFENVRVSGIRAISLSEEDSLVNAKLCGDKDLVMLVSSRGKLITFKESDARPMGRQASGVRGIRIKLNDSLIAMEVIQPTASGPASPAGRQQPAASPKLLTISENGYGKATPLAEYKTQKRGGGGVFTSKVTAKTGLLVCAKLIDSQTNEVILTSRGSQVIRLPAKDLPTLGRQTQGVILMRLHENDALTSVTTLQ